MSAAGRRCPRDAVGPARPATQRPSPGSPAVRQVERQPHLLAARRARRASHRVDRSSATGRVTSTPSRVSSGAARLGPPRCGPAGSTRSAERRRATAPPGAGVAGGVQQPRRRPRRPARRRTRGSGRSRRRPGARQTSSRVPVCTKPAGAHHRHPVGDRERLVVVVGDEQRRGALGPQDVAQVGGEPLAQAAVERRQRLVEQQQPGPDGQRPGQRDPLALAAGQRGRLAVRRSPGARRGRAARRPARARAGRGVRRSRSG